MGRAVVTTVGWRIASGVVFLAAGGLLTSGALADPAGLSIPLGPQGDAIDGSSGAPVALSPTSMLVSTKGADGLPATADDQTLLVTRIGTEPVLVPLATPHVSSDSARITRLSATRAALSTAGADGEPGSEDDAVLVLDRLGSQNRVLPIVVGGLGESQQFTPKRLSTGRIAVASVGPDGKGNTADDQVVIVSDVAGSPQQEVIAVPYQRSGGRSQPIALSDTCLVIAGNGPDRKHSTEDDVVHVLHDIGSGTRTTSIPTPGLNRRAAGRAVRLTSHQALVLAAGPDLKDSTHDDVVLLLDVVANTATPIALPNAKDGSGGRPVVISPTVAVSTTNGEDGVEGTADDALAVITGLGSTNDVSFHVVGATGDDNNCRAVRLGRHTCALVNFGPDLVPETADDRVAVVGGVGFATAVEQIDVGAVAAGTTSTLVRLSKSALLVAGGGEDRMMGTSDDALVHLTGVGSTPTQTLVPAGGSLDAANHFQYVPKVLGSGRVALLASGPDGALGAGGDDAVRVVSGLDLADRLGVRRLRVRLPKAGSTAVARGNVRGHLRLADWQTLLESDVSISIGNASQTLPSGTLQRRGGKLRYDDPDNASGIISKLRYRIRDGRLTVRTRGGGDDLASTSADYVPVSVEIGDTLVPRALVPRRSGRRVIIRK